jgi:ABC-type proline/glycine betaine transport system permease subunit
MKRIVGYLLLVVSIYFLGIGLFESWNLFTKTLDNGLGELSVFFSMIFGFVIGIFFLAIGIFLLRKDKQLK